jgi:TrmH family RNA methyltransferase
MKNIFDQITIVLVEPKNPGNIGSAVRAMKNMGINHLRLVNPVEFREVAEQKKLGYRSQEIIANCQEYPTLQEAVADQNMVFLTTSKKGKWKKDFVLPEQAATIIAQQASKQKIAVVFGREDKGVTIDECQLANYYVFIPSAVSYPSLNLSQAVMVMAYEIFKSLGKSTLPVSFPKMAKKQDFERIYQNIWDLMKSLKINEEDKGLFHRSLKRALNRTHWTNADIAVFDRACKQVRWFTGIEEK